MQTAAAGMLSCVGAGVHRQLDAARAVERPDHVGGEDQLPKDVAAVTHEVIDFQVGRTPPNCDLLDATMLAAFLLGMPKSQASGKAGFSCSEVW